MKADEKTFFVVDARRPSGAQSLFVYDEIDATSVEALPLGE
jgi:hypothetical protein